jgi:hypothetical protein
MAKFKGLPEETSSAMRHIRETTLVRFDSLFSPDRKLWTLQNLRQFHALFVERFDTGEGGWRRLTARCDSFVAIRTDTRGVRKSLNCFVRTDNPKAFRIVVSGHNLKMIYARTDFFS